MSIRVIAGTAKGRRLKLVPGDSTRPIMDRVKEALFSIIGRDIFDSTFLDLFAGTGSVAIEALSRGAGYAMLVDNDRRAIQTIHDNLAATGLAQRARVRQADAFKVIGETPDRVYNYIYVAPPQYKALWTRTLRLLDASPAWLTPDTEVIVQIDPSEFESLEFTRLETRDERRYGNTLLVFYATRSAAGAASPEE
jgi:16S rRNA (guanine(966)-N(2))-methyltransferase RsmD